MAIDPRGVIDREPMSRFQRGLVATIVRLNALDRTVEKVAEEVCRTGRPVDAGQVLELIRKAYREGA